MKIIVAVIGVVVFGLLVFVTVPRTEGQKDDKSRNFTEPTMVKEGVLTVEEREYSREYDRSYGEIMSLLTSKFTEISRRNSDGNSTPVVNIRIPEEGSFYIDNQRKENAGEYLETFYCQSDAIVVGSAVEKTSHLAESEAFIFTSYDFKVTQVKKDNPAAPIALDKNMTITRPGGIIRLNNKVFRIEDENIKLLTPDTQYILFLKYIPSIKGYVPIQGKSDYVIRNSETYEPVSKALNAPDELKRGGRKTEMFAILSSLSQKGCGDGAR